MPLIKYMICVHRGQSHYAISVIYGHNDYCDKRVVDKFLISRLTAPKLKLINNLYLVSSK